ECGMARDAEGELGCTAGHIASCHRVKLDGDLDSGEAKDLLEEDGDPAVPRRADEDGLPWAAGGWPMSD
ncbi:unnamed protein product, partial [Prorocentrum cordatum]